MLLDYSKNRTRRWYLNNEGSTVFNYNEFHMSHCNDWNRRFLSLGQVFIVKELDCKKILPINLREYIQIHGLIVIYSTQKYASKLMFLTIVIREIIFRVQSVANLCNNKLFNEWTMQKYQTNYCKERHNGYSNKNVCNISRIPTLIHLCNDSLDNITENLLYISRSYLKF